LPVERRAENSAFDKIADRCGVLTPYSIRFSILCAFAAFFLSLLR